MRGSVAVCVCLWSDILKSLRKLLAQQIFQSCQSEPTQQPWNKSNWSDLNNSVYLYNLSSFTDNYLHSLQARLPITSVGLCITRELKKFTFCSLYRSCVCSLKGTVLYFFCPVNKILQRCWEHEAWLKSNERVKDFLSECLTYLITMSGGEDRLWLSPAHGSIKSLNLHKSLLSTHNYW